MYLGRIGSNVELIFMELKLPHIPLGNETQDLSRDINDFPKTIETSKSQDVLKRFSLHILKLLPKKSNLFDYMD